MFLSRVDPDLKFSIEWVQSKTWGFLQRLMYQHPLLTKIRSIWLTFRKLIFFVFSVKYENSMKTIFEEQEDTKSTKSMTISVKMISWVGVWLDLIHKVLSYLQKSTESFSKFILFLSSLVTTTYLHFIRNLSCKQSWVKLNSNANLFFGCKDFVWFDWKLIQTKS